MIRTAGDDGDEMAPENHPLNKILKNPNPLQRGNVFKYGLAAFRLLGGNAYAWVNTGITDTTNPDAEPLELWALSPISATLHMEGGAMWYQVNRAQSMNCSGPAIPSSTIPIDYATGRSNIIDWSTFNPKSLCTGVSPLQAADANLDIYRYGNFWNRAYFKQGCRPSTALVSKEGIPDKSYQRMKKELNEIYSGLENGNGRPIILDNGVTPQELSKNPKDADFSNSHDQMQKDIARAFRIPPILLNIGGDTTYSNQKEARLALWDDVIVPLTNDLCQELNENLVPRFRDQNLYLAPDYSKIPALEERRKEMWERADKSKDLTIDETRAMKGYPPLPGGAGQTLLVEANKIPIDMAVIQLPGE
jgi:HK97 family phage portal protein